MRREERRRRPAEGPLAQSGRQEFHRRKPGGCYMEPLISRREFVRAVSASSVGLAVSRLARAANLERYQPTWESLAQYRVPAWYEDAKFGIFLHWGVYSVPAHENEWYPRLMYRRESQVFNYHRERWGPQSMFGYKDFIPMFRAERWDPEAWAEHGDEVLVTEHGLRAPALA